MASGGRTDRQRSRSSCCSTPADVETNAGSSLSTESASKEALSCRPNIPGATSVLIVDDHRGYSNMFEMLIERQPDMGGAGETET